MATRTLPAALAAVLLLTGCVSPYEASIKTDLEACHAGNKDACSEATALTQADAQWHEQKNREVGNAMLGILAVGLVGAAAYGAAHPAPPPPPVFVPAPPIPVFVPPPPVIYLH